MSMKEAVAHFKKLTSPHHPFLPPCPLPPHRQLARQYDMLIIEDDPYYFLQFDKVRYSPLRPPNI